jgi:two-component system cell cycle sensor histidine kinase/response regulator CckA
MGLRVSTPSRFAVARYGLATVLVAAALGIRLVLDPVVETYAPFLPFTLAVLMAGRFGGSGPALAATGTSILATWYFLMDPPNSFAFANAAQPASLALFAMVGIGISLITGQLRRALAISRQNEAQLRRFTESAPVALAMFDRDMRYLAASGTYRQEYRLGDQPLEGRSHYEVFPEIPERWREVHRRVLAGSSEGSEEDLFERLDGRTQWLRWEMRPWHHAGGRIGGAVLASEDITLRKQADAALRQSEQRFRVLFEHAADGIYITSPEGSYIEVNARGLELAGCSRDEFVGTSIADFVHPTDRHRVAAEVAQLKTGQPTYGEWRFVRRDGSTFHGDVSARQLPDGSFLGILRDLTDRRRLQEQFLQAQKLEGIGRLAGGVAHDFNNLLTVIGGYSRMGLEELPEDHALRGSLTEIERAAERAAALTRQLLAFSRNQPAELRTIVPDEVIRDFEKMLRRIIGEDVELTLALDASGGAIRADAGHLEQVVLNLAVNARDAMPAGGKLLIESSRLSADAEFVEALPGTAPGEYVSLTVSDTGTGMPEEVKAHLFEPFYTTKEPGRGTGLGLSTVYGIVRQSGGSIRVYSEIGHGSSFHLLFPAVEPGSEPVRAVVPAITHTGTETILLVEDEPALRKYVRRVLERRGYTVLEAVNGRQALEAARTIRPDLLLTDLVMPEIGGVDLAAVFGGPAGIPVICMSGYSDRLWPVGGPAVAFLQKPFTPTSLLERVRQALATQVPPDHPESDSAHA